MSTSRYFAPNGTAGFALFIVNGKSLVPLPPPRTIVSTPLSSRTFILASLRDEFAAVKFVIPSATVKGLDTILKQLQDDDSFNACVSRWERIPARPATYAGMPEDLDSRIRKSLEDRGIHELYTHQVESWEAARAGRDFVVVTPTASGKTLCYNLPVLQRILEKPESRALYLFPTKALSQDQQSELNETVLAGELGVKIVTYDGDTPVSLRVSARDTGQIVISNPDMLHAGVLPNHPKWIKFLRNLEYIVIDEVHTYRGVFGSHLTNLIRRLKRIAAFYGSDPTFICCSATIGNPRELASQVVEKDMHLIDRNGAPSGEKHLILYNPPLVDRVQGIRRGVVNESQKLALRFLKSGVKTIVFSRSRVRTELIASYINKSLANMYTDNNRICVEAYRGGYLPNERRAIEKGLRDGSIQGVVSTNALELGIDIGGLDAAILGGYPGSIASAWQQAGRAGRRSSVSIAVVVASAAPLDQYMVKHPEYYLGRPPESGFVDPDNPYVLTDHLKCAVFELPFKDPDPFPPESGAVLENLEESGVVRRTGDSYYWADRSYPAEEISLRSATSDNVVIVDTTGGRNEVIGEMDRPSAKEMIFTNAVYIHRGDEFIVTQLDLENRRCYVESTDVSYFTDAIVKRDIKVLHEDERTPIAGCEIVVGDILVRSQVAKFKKLRFRTHENIGFGEISLPEEEMHTRAAVLVFSGESAAGKALKGLPVESVGPAVARIGTLLRNVAPVFLLCDSRDLGVSERVRDPHFGAPALYVYDSYPGGTGLAEALGPSAERILSAARDVVRNCPCAEGCPSCIGPRDPEEEIDGSPKDAVLAFLESWLGAGGAG
jgi:DEAD/DEAH box helicase domain-containing protein